MRSTQVKAHVNARRRGDEGSIAVFVTVSLVATGLVAAMLVQVQFGLKTSRRAGDSANALQVADAAINEAVQQAGSVAGTAFSRTGTVGDGSFTYTATQDSLQTNIWHIDAVGTDETGVKRHVKADAYGETQFTSPMYVKNFLGVGAGALLDSYYSGLNTTTGCTKKGVISMADGGKVTFTSGGKGNANCTGRLVDTSWTWSMDGCVVYHKTNSFPPTGQAQCPPAPYTWREQKDFPSETVGWPEEGITSPTNGKTGSSFTCSSTSPFKAGGVYSYTTVVLNNGCYIDWGTLAKSDYYSYPVTVYGSTITIGSSTKSVVNAPSTSTCPTNTAGWAYADATNNPAVYYCPGWSQTLRLKVPGDGKVIFDGSGTSAWTIISAPESKVTLKAPQLEMFGAMVASEVDVKSQFSWHYDETLTSVGTGKFSVQNWREEAL
jgi:hypothetical protein